MKLTNGISFPFAGTVHMLNREVIDSVFAAIDRKICGRLPDKLDDIHTEIEGCRYSLSTETKSLLGFIKKYGLVIGGGAVRDIVRICNKPVSVAPVDTLLGFFYSTFNDLDLFVPNKEECMNSLNSYLGVQGAVTAPSGARSINFRVKGRGLGDGCKVQLILPEFIKFQKIEELANSFDFTMNCGFIWWDSRLEEWVSWVDPDFVSHAVNKILCVKNVERIALSRVFRFLSEGYVKTCKDDFTQIFHNKFLAILQSKGDNIPELLQAMYGEYPAKEGPESVASVLAKLER
jgi:hypothetical protein